MSKLYTVKCPDTGEIQAVFDPGGNPGWEVLSSTTTAVTDEHEYDEAQKKWVKSSSRKEARNREVAAKDGTKLLARIEALEETVQKLTAEVAALKKT